MLMPPESGCEREYGDHRMTGAGTPGKVRKNAVAHGRPHQGTFPYPDRQVA